MATLHLISGLPCSGKTTYSTELRARRSAVLFTLDRWLITLFGRYSIAEIGHDEHVRRVRACRELIAESALELLKREGDVILDDGFFLRRDREHFASLARGVGADVAVHLVEAPLEVVRQRLQARNSALPTHNFAIDPALLDQFLDLFERPSEAEGVTLVLP